MYSHYIYVSLYRLLMLGAIYINIPKQFKETKLLTTFTVLQFTLPFIISSCLALVLIQTSKLLNVCLTVPTTNKNAVQVTKSLPLGFKITIALTKKNFVVWDKLRTILPLTIALRVQKYARKTTHCL